MATNGAPNTLSEQESNFLRFANLVLRICPKAVRVVFDKCFLPAGLGSYLKIIKPKIEALCKRRIINQSHMNSLYHTQGTSQVKSTDFDITLMLCLLRNFQNVKFSNELPKPAEIKPENDLSRINYYRNFIAHHSTGELDNNDFKQEWQTLTKAVERIGGTNLKAECDQLLSCQLESSVKEDVIGWINHERKLNEQERELVAVKSRVEELEIINNRYKENLCYDVEEWVEKDKVFFETTAVTKIEEKVKANSFVLICGASGMGKSATAFHLALQWCRGQNYEILPIIEPQDIMRFASTETNQIFIVDDFCGKFVTDTHQCEAWDT